MEVEVGVMYQQAHEGQGWTARRGYPQKPAVAWSGLSPRASRGIQVCRHLGFGLLASRTVREYILTVVSHLGCGNCYGSPGKLVKAETQTQDSLLLKVHALTKIPH